MGVSVTNISKSYNGTKALQDLSFEISDGELFGLIGPDGAGKTTVFRILTTLLIADQGSATVAGLDVLTDYKTIRKSVGYMPGKFSLYQDLTVEENLKFFATIFGTTIEDNYDVIKEIYVQIEPFKTRRAGKLSGGMKQKLAQVVIGETVTVKIDDQDGMKTYDGTISWIASEAEFTPKIIQTKEERIALVYAVNVQVKNDGSLKIGVPAEMWLDTKSNQ